jgi:hypothetical protein
MKITIDWLIDRRACSDGIDFFKEHFGEEAEHEELINTLLEADNNNVSNNDKFNYAAWIIACILDKENSVKLAIFCAELVLPIFEKRFPENMRPRKVLEAAKKYLTASARNKDTAAVAAYDAAYDVGFNSVTDTAASEAAFATAFAATAAAASDTTYATAYNAAYAATAAANATYVAARASASAASATSDADIVKQKIINYGLELIKTEEQNNEKKQTRK